MKPGARDQHIIDMIYNQMINPPKVDYGLFRATRSHNPPSIRALVVLSHHYALM